jgi:segregation and condensation protein A
MSSSALQVELDLFRGPLHTLLDLIERRELPVTRVSLVEVADQFLAVVRDAPSLDLDLTAEFLYVATRLLLLKSQALLPQRQGDEQRDGGDEEDDLEGRLLIYRRFRDAARLLAERQVAGLRSFGHPAPSAAVPPLPPGLVELDASRLRRLAQRALTRLRDRELAAAAAPGPLVPFTEILDVVLAHLRARPRTSFRALAAEATDVIAAVTMFLAVLELVRRRHVIMQQDGSFGPIELTVEGGEG